MNNKKIKNRKLKYILGIVMLLFLPSLVYAKTPEPEYVTMKVIKETCGLGEVFGCLNIRQGRILIYWKVQAHKELKEKVYWHEVGHWLTRKWHREDYINKLGYANVNENDVITLSERMARDYEGYKTIGIKDKRKIEIFKQLN